ncbi:MAG TPA: hypothetical protein PK593_05255, partial [Thermomicrobiales bacterium]|nr:hypothetical protein [Thermomicrobiales bacterium]
FWDEDGEENLSEYAWTFVDRILSSALDLCLMLNPSVNGYRRLDPAFEAPNAIKASPSDRGSMVRIPIADRKSSRVEVRSIAPDANPYMVIYSLLSTGLEGPLVEGVRGTTSILPDNIYDAITHLCGSNHAAELLGPEVRDRFGELKKAVAVRSPRALGTMIKTGEIQFHHEVTNQHLWRLF